MIVCCWKETDTKEGLIVKKLYQSQKLSWLIDIFKIFQKDYQPDNPILIGTCCCGPFQEHEKL